MTPQPTVKHHKIDIRYSAIPPGQVGVRPLTVRRNHTFEFVQHDPGTLTMEFFGSTPLAGGIRTVSPGQVVTVVNSGRFPFRCKLVRPNGQVAVLDPTIPGVPSGGELEVPPGIDG
jgi:hypothetical protein